MSDTTCHLLVVSYVDTVREALVASLAGLGLSCCACSTFKDAEQQALTQAFSGVLVDLMAMIKAKDEEKIIACSLTNIYPTLRVRAMGTMLVPMTMPGTASQDKSLGDFVGKTCQASTPRKLRAHRRYDLNLSATITGDGESTRLVTLNVSWSGAYLVDLHPERVVVREQLTVTVAGIAGSLPVQVVWVQPWQGRGMPGYGVRFLSPVPEQHEALRQLLPPGSEQANDRLVG
jgi:CheY-like chemotaxis protein